MADEWDLLTGRMQTNANQSEGISAKTRAIIDTYNKLNPTLAMTDEQWKNMSTTLQIAIIDKYQKASEATANLSTNFDDIPNHILAANTALVKHSDAVSKLSDDYDKMSQQGTTDLASLADSFQTKMASIDSAIAKTQQSITDLQSSYANQTQGQTATVADDIVASENKIADIKKQIGKATTASQLKSLQEQLVAEQANYDSSAAFRASHASEIATAEARAKETDLQRTIDDYNSKQALETAAFNQKLSDLQQQLVAQQSEAANETALYKKKVFDINAIMDAGQEYFKALSADRVSVTTKEVDAEIAQFQRLAAIISGMKSASSSTLSTFAPPTFTSSRVTKVNDAILTPGGDIVQTDVADYIIATKDPSALTKQNAGGSTTINVTIQNPTVRNSNDLTEMRKMIDSIMRPLLINAKIAHI